MWIEDHLLYAGTDHRVFSIPIFKNFVNDASNTTKFDQLVEERFLQPKGIAELGFTSIVVVKFATTSIDTQEEEVHRVYNALKSNALGVAVSINPDDVNVLMVIIRKRTTKALVFPVVSVINLWVPKLMGKREQSKDRSIQVPPSITVVSMGSISSF